MSREHLLKQLKLPDRYERLSEQLGPEVVQILVPPQSETLDKIERAAFAVSTRDEGLLVPVHGDSGVGKTTLIENLTHFLPAQFTSTLTFTGELNFEELESAAREFTRDFPSNESRVLPVNIDQREDYAPTKREMSDIKKFLRTSKLPVRPSMFWPDTDVENAKNTAAQYTNVAGASPIPLPLEISGPAPSAWADIAKNTLRVANSIGNYSAPLA